MEFGEWFVYSVPVPSCPLLPGPHKVLVLFSPQVLPLLQDFPPVVRDHLELALGRLLGAEAGAAGRAPAGSLFQVLLQCQEQPSPCCYLLAEGLRARAPILSVLAACCPVSLHLLVFEGIGNASCWQCPAVFWGALDVHGSVPVFLGSLCTVWPLPPTRGGANPSFWHWQDANLISCLCVWIITSVDDATRAEATAHTQSGAESPQWDLQDLAAIWRVFLRKQKSKTLLNGFQLFLKVRECGFRGMFDVYHLVGL